MRIVTLVENTSGSENCIAEHGLSIYVETEKHKLLLDTGQTDALIHNAEVLGINLSSVDTVVLSHGHYDHSGGIIPLSRINNKAHIFMQKNAAEPHFNGEKYIGIDQSVINLPGILLLDGNHKIDDELSLFSGITERRCYPQGNLKLSSEKSGERIQDDFSHEQCLVISQDNKSWLLSGCAHNGILNIIDRYREIFGNAPDYVISGFHMMKRDGEYTDDEISVIQQTAKELADMDTVFWSGHCTGEPAFEIMKKIMGNKLNALHSGEDIQIKPGSL